MTYCIGFKSETAVFLIADSVISRRRNEEIEEVLGENTTFGEPAINNTETNQDSRYKVLELPGDVLVTFAGDVNDSLEAISIYKRGLNMGLDPISAFQNVYAAGPFTQIELLIGFIVKGAPKLYSYNYNGSGQFREEHSIVHLGSGRDHDFLSEKTSEVIGHFLEEQYNDKKCLVFASAFLQNFAIKNPLYKLGVGGFFYGAYAFNGGIQKMSNTCYLMYAVIPNMQGKQLLFNYEVSLVRDGEFLLVSSSFVDHTRLYIQEIDDEDVPSKEFCKEKFNELKESYFSGQFDFTVLLNQMDYGFTVCCMKNEDKEPEITVIPDEEAQGVRIIPSIKLSNYLKNTPALKPEDMDQLWDRSHPAHIEIAYRYFP